MMHVASGRHVASQVSKRNCMLSLQRVFRESVLVLIKAITLELAFNFRLKRKQCNFIKQNRYLISQIIYVMITLK